MPIIRVKPIDLIYYADKKVHTFWLHEDVIEGFREGIEHWTGAGGTFHVTETLRSIEVQARLKKQKPALANKPGWSLHGHGRAVDFSTAAVGAAHLKDFYEHMQRFGWYTIFNFPGGPVMVKSRESWHIQCTRDPALQTEPGMRAKDYLTKWAAANGGEKTLLDLQYERLAAPVI